MSLGHWMRCLALVVSCAGFVACSSDDPDSDGEGLEELPEEVTVKVGSEGGVVKAKGVSLQIPEGALDKDVMISAKKVDVAKVMLPEQTKERLSAVYEFGPKGTTFKKDVTVQFDTEKEDPKAKVFFTKENAESEFEQLASNNEGKSVSAKTKHFSLGFVGVPADDGDVTADAGLGVSDAGTPGKVDAGGGDGLPDSGAGQPDAAAQDATITVTSVDPYGLPANQTWLAYQDGDEPWQVISAAPTGTYTFELKSSRYGLAYVCGGAASSGNVLFATAARRNVDIKQMAYCASVPTLVSRSGTIAPPASPTSGNYRYSHKWYTGFGTWSNPSDLDYTFDKIWPGHVTDLVVGLDTGGIPAKLNVFRGLSLPANDFQGLNLNTAGFTPQQHTLTVLGVKDTTLDARVEYTVNNSNIGILISSPPVVTGSSATLTFGSLPQANHAAGDRHRFFVVDEVAAEHHTRSIDSFSTSTSPVQLTLPADFDATIVQVGGYDRFTPSATFSDVGADEYSMYFNYVAVPNAHFFSTRVEKGWFPAGETTHTLVFPDLRALPGFQTGWLPPTTQTTTVSAGAVVFSSDAVSSTETSSEFSANLPGSLPPG